MTNFKKKDRNLFWITLLAIIVILVLWFVNYKFGMNLTPESRGVFGDMFGAVNAIFSGFAFAGIIITIILQRNELIEQRGELKMTRVTFEKQLFENTFFEMLKIHNQNVQDFSFNDKKGREALREVLKKYESIYFKLDKGLNNQNISSFKNYSYRERLSFLSYYLLYRGADNQFEVFLKDDRIEHGGIIQASLDETNSYANPNDFNLLNIKNHYVRLKNESLEYFLSSYYRHLFQIVKFVHDAPDSRFLPLDYSNLSPNEKSIKIKKAKYSYIRNLRSQLSLDQQSLFVLNVVSGFGQEWSSYYSDYNDEPVNLISEYGIIKNLHYGVLKSVGVKLKDEFPNIKFYGEEITEL